MTPQPSRPATSGRTDGSTRVHWPCATSVRGVSAPMPRAAVSPVPSASLIGRAALAVSKQYHGSPRRQARHWPADGPPVEDDVVAHPYVRDALADGGDVDDDLARARVGDDDVEQFDRRAPGS
ncbi:hypothetical protein [Propionibacterium acidifaciens]|uniref:hypothetical protein n=1 Tax=Propionibacterium acidifaciens TaxID=556499 RepID=UPI00361E23DF